MRDTVSPPRVSVLLPVRDGEAFLEEALDSLEAQDFPDYEVVVVDDGSSDGTGDLLEQRARTDSRIRVIRQEAAGIVPALNRALDASRGPLLARFDADDRMDPRRLSLQVAYLDAHPSIDVVSCLVRHFPEADVREGNRIYEQWLNGLVNHDQIAASLFVESPLPSPSVIVRRRVFDRIGGYRDPGWAEDYDFWLRSRAAGFRFGKVPQTLLFWREHPKRLTRTDPRCSVQSFLRAKTAFLVDGPLAGETRPLVVWGTGRIGRRLTRLLRRAGRAPVALLDRYADKVGRVRQGLPVLPPEAVRNRGALVLGAVGARHAREAIRRHLGARGFVETRDFWMVA